jgi:uncharacterized membrane protein
MRDVPLLGWLWRVIVVRPRLMAGFVLGVVAYCLVPSGYAPQARAVVSWDVGVTIYLVAAAVLFLDERQDRMAADAERQQEGEWTIFFMTVAAVVMSFVALVFEFSSTRNVPGSQRTLHVAIVAFTLFASWLMTHVTFAFRYAHEFYEQGQGGDDYERGLEFPGERSPDYLDFLYFSLVLGMTFQVSDVQITSRKLRRLATLHGLLSFLFNTVIVALTVNIAAGLL